MLQQSYSSPGFGWIDTSGKLSTVQVNVNGNNFEFATWSNPTTRVGNAAISTSLRQTNAGLWLGLRDDNAGKVIWEVSQTGAYWSILQTVTKSGSYLADYGAIFIGLFNQGTNPDIAVSALAWDISAISGRVVGFVG
jgi:hypothetical protein